MDVKKVESYEKGETATGSLAMRSQGDGSTKTSDTEIGKLFEIATESILAKDFGFPRLSLGRNFEVRQKGEKGYDVDLYYPSVDPHFPGVHCKSTACGEVSGSLQWKDLDKDRRDAIFWTHDTVIEEQARFVDLPNLEGGVYDQAWIGWFGTSNSTELVVLGFVNQAEGWADFYGWVPWKYALEQGLLQNPFRSDRVGLKRCIYVENTLYRMGVGTSVYLPERNQHLSVPRLG